MTNVQGLRSPEPLRRKSFRRGYRTFFHNLLEGGDVLLVEGLQVPAERIFRVGEFFLAGGAINLRQL